MVAMVAMPREQTQTRGQCTRTQRRRCWEQGLRLAQHMAALERRICFTNNSNRDNDLLSRLTPPPLTQSQLTRRRAAPGVWFPAAQRPANLCTRARSTAERRSRTSQHPPGDWSRRKVFNFNGRLRVRGVREERPLITSSELPHHLYRRETRGEVHKRPLITPPPTQLPHHLYRRRARGEVLPRLPHHLWRRTARGEVGFRTPFRRQTCTLPASPCSSVCLPRILFGSRRGVRLRAGACTPQRCARVFTAAAALLRARDWRVRGPRPR